MRVCATALLSLLLCTVNLAVAEQPKGAEYYPLQVGNEWKYRQTEKSSGFQFEVIERITESSKDDPSLFTLAVEAAGSPEGTEIVSVQEDGIYRHEAKGMKLEPPLRIVAFPLADGTKWKSSTKAGGFRLDNSYTCKADKVKVPAGEFECICISGGNSLVRVQLWLAPGVGKVKQITQGYVSVTSELESYQVGDRKK